MKLQIKHIATQEVLITFEFKNRGSAVMFTEGFVTVSQAPNNPSGPGIPAARFDFDPNNHDINIGQ